MGRKRMQSQIKRASARAVLSGAYRLGLPRAIRRLLPNSLSILAYHRIADPTQNDFFGLRWNVSATPSCFVEQLNYIKGECNAISLAVLEAAIAGKSSLPENAVLITFDDGYRDNYSIALPEITKRELPAVLFAATGFIDGHACPFWDWVTEAFRNTQVNAANLPLIGSRQWRLLEDRANVANEWIRFGIDHSSHRELRAALKELSAILQVSLPNGTPPGLTMNWDELKAMADSGFAIGAHTVTHPVLLQTNIGRAEREIRISKIVLERQTGRTISAFAYPNGLFTDQHERLLAEANYKMGLRVEGGLTFQSEMSARPFAIRRSCITLKDDLPRFAAKVAGASRIL